MASSKPKSTGSHKPKLEKEPFDKVHRDVYNARIADTDSFIEKLYYVLRRDSTCFPNPCPYFTPKDKFGAILRWKDGQPDAGNQVDLARAMGITYHGNKSQLSRGLKHFVSTGFIEIKDRKFYINQRPSLDKLVNRERQRRIGILIGGQLIDTAKLVFNPAATDLLEDDARAFAAKITLAVHQVASERNRRFAAEDLKLVLEGYSRVGLSLLTKTNKRKKRRSVVPSSVVEDAPEQPIDRPTPPPEPPPTPPTPPVEQPAAAAPPIPEVQTELRKFLESRYPDIPSAVPVAVIDELAVKAGNLDGVAHFQMWCAKNVKPGRPDGWRYFLRVMDSSLPERENWLKRFRPPEPAQPSEAETRELTKRTIRKMWKNRDDPMFTQWLKEEEERDPELYKEALRDVPPD